MKRILFVSSLCLLVALMVVSSHFVVDVSSSEELQFSGSVTNGASQGDPVNCYKVSPGPTELKASVLVRENLTYRIGGNDSDFPDAYYKLVAKEGEEDEGSITLYHYEGQATTANIQLGKDIVQ